MSTAPYEQAIATAKSVLAGVKPNQIGATTPCASWKVSDVLNHLVGEQFWFAQIANGSAKPAAPSTDFSAGDFNSAFAQGSAEALAALKADGAMEKVMHLPFGDMPGSVVAGMAALDTFVHAWDVACGTGQTTDLNPQLADELLAGARVSVPDAFRGEDRAAPFGLEQKAPAGASKADQLAAFLGRKI